MSKDFDTDNFYGGADYYDNLLRMGGETSFDGVTNTGSLFNEWSLS